MFRTGRGPYRHDLPPLNRPAQRIGPNLNSKCGKSSDSWSKLLALYWNPFVFNPILLMRKLRLRGFHNSLMVTRSVVETAFESKFDFKCHIFSVSSH